MEEKTNKSIDAKVKKQVKKHCNQAEVVSIDPKFNIKHERSADYVLILPNESSKDKASTMPVPLQVKIENSPQSNIKHEESVDYILVLPNDRVKDKFDGMPAPLKIKKKDELTESTAEESDAKRGVRCTRCDKENYFGSIESLNEHNKKKHFVCSSCNAVFKNQNGFEVHQLNATFSSVSIVLRRSTIREG